MSKKYRTVLLSLLGMLLCNIPLDAQTKTKGFVTNDVGEALREVLITVERTGQALITDDEGFFSLENMEEQEQIVVKKEGYRMRNMEIQRPANLPDRESGEEYDKRNPDITIVLEAYEGSMERLKKNWKSILSNNPTLFFERNLMGQESGVYYSRNGYAGNAGMLMLRGVSTVNLATTPYIIVEGQPVKLMRSQSSIVPGVHFSNTGFLNPLDIADIKILKNGYEGSLYGGKAANGVIEVTIDEGEMGSTAIDVMTRVGFSRADYSLNMLPTEDFRSFLYGMMLDRGDLMTDLEKNILFDPQHSKYNHQTNWLNSVKRDGGFNDFQLRMRGGDGTTRYLFGLGYTAEDETLEPSDYQRFNMRFKLNFRINPKVSINTNFAYTYGMSKFLGEGTDWDVNPIFLAATKAPFMSPNQYSDAGADLLRPADDDVLGKSNPSLLASNLQNDGVDNRIDAVIKGLWTINTKTSANIDLMVSYNSMMEKQHRKAYGIVPFENIERQNFKRSFSEFMMKMNMGVGRTGQLTEDIHFDAKAGFSLEINSDKSIFARRINAPTDDYVSVQIGTADTVSNISYDRRLLNFYANGKFYSAQGVSLSLSAGLERTSNFGPDGAWIGYFGAKFNAPVLKMDQHTLGVYLDAGRTGNYDVRDAYYLQMYRSANYFAIGGFYLSNLENKNLKPEITGNYAIGANGRLFGDMVNVTMGYYLRRTKGLLMMRTLPIESGLDPQYANAGNVINHGFELEANVDVLRETAVKWSVFANLSTLKNKVKSLKYGDVVRGMDKFTGIARDGEALGSFYGYKVKGIFNTAGEVNLTMSDGTPFQAGDYIMEDIDGNHIINEADRQIIGSPLPDIYGGFGTNVSYKGLSLSMLFTYSCGNDVYNLFRQKLHSMEDFSNQSSEVLNRWLSEDQIGNGFLPRAAYGDPSNNFATSDRWVEDGSYLKFRNVSVNYEVPLKHRTGFVKGINLFASCMNLFTITGYKGFDPEVFSSADPLLRGVDTGALPNPQSYIFGVKIAL